MLHFFCAVWNSTSSEQERRKTEHKVETHKNSRLWHCVKKPEKNARPKNHQRKAKKEKHEQRGEEEEQQVKSERRMKEKCIYGWIEK